MPKLPTVTSDIPRDLRTFLDRVREAMSGMGPDSLVSARQLVAAGIAQYNGSGITVAPGEIEAATPPRPTNVEADGALANIMITWDKPLYKGHSYAEIWAAAQSPEQEAAGIPPTLGDAELVGMAPGRFFAHNVGAAAVRWYWVRFVNLLGVVGPYQGTDGIRGETSPDPGYLLDLLTGVITQSQLYKTLSDRIDLIDGPITLLGSVNDRLHQEALARGTAITNLTNVVNTGDAQLAQSINTLTAVVNNNTAAIQQEATTRANADSAEALLRTELAAQVGDNWSAFQEEVIARADGDTALTQSLTSLGATVNANWASFQAEVVTRAQADAAEATARETLAATVGSNTAAIETEKQVRASETGDLFGQYTVKIDLNGYVSGYGLASSVVNGTPTSSFIIRADSFAIGAPGQPSIGYVLPFVVQTTATTINGESVPAGVYIDQAYIKNGTITNAKIGDAAIDDAKIANLDAGKITTGYLDADRIEAGSIDANKIDTRQLTIKDAYGNILFGSGYNLASSNVDGLGDLALKDSVSASEVVNLTTYIQGVSIDFAQINDAIYSNGFVSGSQGWRLFKNGNVEFNSGTFRGQLDVASATSGSRLEIDGDQIRVYEGSSLRVVLGRL
jgi:hypothetical protein